MNVQQAIQSSANVIRVTSIAPGDVYKRFDDGGYDDRVYYGVVQSVHNDGQNAIIEALEYCYKYSSLSIEIKVLRGNKDYQLFPATPDDLRLELDGVIERKNKEITEHKSAIEKLEKEISAVEGLMSGETLKQLRAMSYKETTQSQYEARKIEAGL